MGRKHPSMRSVGRLMEVDSIQERDWTSVSVATMGPHTVKLHYPGVPIGEFRQLTGDG